jgi:Variant SH3 domain
VGRGRGRGGRRRFVIFVVCAFIGVCAVCSHAPAEWGEEEEAAEEGGEGTCVALYDYAGENDGDLVFSEGDVITLLDTSDPEGWWQGDLNGTTGYFPNNYVEKQ